MTTFRWLASPRFPLIRRDNQSFLKDFFRFHTLFDSSAALVSSHTSYPSRFSSQSRSRCHCRFVTSMYALVPRLRLLWQGSASIASCPSSRGSFRWLRYPLVHGLIERSTGPRFSSSPLTSQSRSPFLTSCTSNHIHTYTSTPSLCFFLPLPLCLSASLCLCVPSCPVSPFPPSLADESFANE